MTNLMIILLQYSGGSEYGHPIHSTENMPEDIITYGALAGFVFLLLVGYSYFKQNEKKKFK